MERRPTHARFDGLADLYARARPDYPRVALEHVRARTGLAQGEVAADIGSGTGISTRLVAGLGWRVIGIEPNAEMRARAEEVAATGSVEYRAGTGEATGLEDGSVALVVCAQVFHWLEPEAALHEFRRVLRPDGWVALLWNERDERDPATAAYGAVLRWSDEAADLEDRRRRAGYALLESPWFVDGERVDFPHEQVLERQGAIERALSVSYAPRDAADRERFVHRLEEILERHGTGDRLRLSYRTTVWTARRSGEPG